MPVITGAPSWTWAEYLAKVQALGANFPGYPVGVNVDPIWWSMQLDRAQFTITTDILSPPSFRSITGSVTYASSINIDGDADEEILQVAWKAGVPSEGHLLVTDFANGVLQGTSVFAIDGASNVWSLQNHNNGTQLIVLMGMDEGKLGTTPLSQANAETLIYNPATNSIVHTGIITSSHESCIVDFDHDGDDDIIAANWSEPANGQLVWLRNDGNTLVAVPFAGPPVSAMAVEAIDVDNDGDWELVVTDASTFNTIPGINGERNQILDVAPDLTLSVRAELPLPYFERATFEGIPFLPGWDGGVGRSHDVQMVAADIDADGDEDLVMSSMIWGGGPEFAAYQILVNTNGTLNDETDTRMFNMLLPVGGTHNFTMRDVNHDGFVDIVGQNGGPANWQMNGVDRALTHGNNVYVNDGTGHFVSVSGYQYFEDPGWSVFTFSETNGLPRWTQVQELVAGQLTIKVAEYAHALSTGPGLIDPATQGAPGFNEFYYLLNNTDVRTAVESGVFTSGLAHFLAVGRAQGRMAFAPHAIVNGSEAADAITLREGHETAHGRGGNDTIIGGAGADTIDGGDGIDVVSYAGSDAAVAVNKSTGVNSGGHASGDILTAVEHIIGSIFADTLTGGTSNDIFTGGAGSDRIIGGAGVDTASYAHSAGAVAINLPTNANSGGEAQGDFLSSIENIIGSSLGDNITGSTSANVLNGQSGNDTLSGGSGNDTLDGGIGADAMTGDLGNDTFIVDSTGDRVYESAAGGTDKVIASLNYRLLATSEIERFEAAAGTAALTLEGNGYGQTLVGNAGDNRLKGMVGNDMLHGSLGNDSLYGGNGVDVLTGGAGLDSFVFDFAPNRTTNVDTITDYSVADDRFLLDDAAFVGIGATGALGAARFKLGTAATDADDRIVYDAATGKVYFDANGNVAGGQIHFATVAIGTALTAGEFVVF